MTTAIFLALSYGGRAGRGEVHRDPILFCLGSSSPAATSSMRESSSAFSFSCFTSGQLGRVRTAKLCSARRRSLQQTVVLPPQQRLRQIQPRSSIAGGNQPVPPPAGDESYLQCPQCLAVYQLDADELEGPSRVVACSGCLHEWYASEDALLWGDEIALQALVSSAASNMPSKNLAKEVTSSTGLKNTPNEDTSREKTAMISDFGAIKRQGARRADVNIDINGNSKAPVEEQRIETEEDEMDDMEVGQKESQMPSDTMPSDTMPSDTMPSDTMPFQEEQASDTESNSISDIGERGQDTSSSMETDTNVNESSASRTDDDGSFSIFVGNLSFRATEEDLYRAFSGYGFVVKCQVPCDLGGASKGYGFVEMRSRDSGLQAIDAMQGASILGRDVSLTEARHRAFQTRRTYRPGSGPPDGRRRRNFDERREGERRSWSGQNTSGRRDSPQR